MLKQRANRLVLAAIILGSITLFEAGVALAEAGPYSFRAPAGWQLFSQGNLSGRAVAIWRGPTDTKFGENILLLVRPTSLALGEASAPSAVAAGMPGAQVSRRAITVCGGHPAMYVYAVAPFRGNTLVSENVISVWDKTAYSATYSRLNYQRTVQGARSALTTLCPPCLSTSRTSW